MTVTLSPADASEPRWPFASRAGIIPPMFARFAAVTVCSVPGCATWRACGGTDTAPGAAAGVAGGMAGPGAGDGAAVTPGTPGQGADPGTPGTSEMPGTSDMPGASEGLGELPLAGESDDEQIG